ncbi:MAG: hypothetical protein GX442_22690 [Candidatus Riflebacteria bacterium]|nr:hypothetical protein [Candidatus Riflebacteria bacterium]
MRSPRITLSWHECEALESLLSCLDEGLEQTTVNGIPAYEPGEEFSLVVEASDMDALRGLLEKVRAKNAGT